MIKCANGGLGKRMVQWQTQRLQIDDMLEHKEWVKKLNVNHNQIFSGWILL